MESESERATRLAKEGLDAMDVGDNANARRLFEECMAIRQSLGDQIGVAKALNLVANITIQEGDEEGAKTLWGQSLEMQRALNNLRGMHCPLANLSGAAYRAGDYVLLRDLEEQMVAVARALDDSEYLAHSLDSLTQTAIFLQDYPYARRVQQESLAIKKAVDLREDMPSSLKLCAEVASATHDCERSAVFYGAYAKQCALLARPQHLQEKEQLAADMAALESRMGEIPYKTAYSAGKLMTLEQAAEAATEFCATPTERK
ncbi:MAG: hypothetical protein JWL77_4107 [Chthonomonadaceae bacterium]|nr:hypothetical protein [Chthonomonadaceae bacterium]